MMTFLKFAFAFAIFLSIMSSSCISNKNLAAKRAQYQNPGCNVATVVESGGVISIELQCPGEDEHKIVKFRENR